jgi:uncharacterized protein (TIGR02145 family)
MKKILLIAAFIAASFTGIAQVGVGTTTPAGALDIVSTTSGLVLPRVANTSVVVNPNGGAIENGTMVFDLSLSCINVYVNGAWTGCIQSAAVPLPTSQVSSDGNEGFYTFLSHNLGADTSLDPHTPVVGLQGGYVQWGKQGPTNWVGAANDGPNGFAAAPTSGNDNSAAISDWSTSNAADGSWNVDENNPIKVSANDPCPTGYRVPTRNEWVAVNTNNTVSRTGTFASGNTEYGSALHYGPDASTKLLTLPVAGYYYRTNGALYDRGGIGKYWSSTEHGINANVNNLNFGSSDVSPGGSNNRADGFSVRCIAE